MTTAKARPVRLPTTARYEFQKAIGSGGVGTVYRALDRRTGELVAIKVLKVKLSEHPLQHQRFAREFRAASQLEHPNIVRALEFETEGEVSYLVYELIEAGSAADRIEQHGRFPEDVAVRITTQISQALDYAHERQVVHRDVKPDNILLLPDGRAKLTDFGLAKDYNTDDQLTRHASGLGTPHFMAPEQFADAASVDARCDVYSLAATLFTLVTGQLPFDAKFPLAILANKETKQPPSARAVVPGVSERVDAAIRAALHPDAACRPPTCLEFFKLLTGRRRTKENVAVTPAPALPVLAPADDRRTAARFSLRVGSCASVESGIHETAETRELWPLTVRDVSAGGVGLLLARRFEPGTPLEIELGSGPATAARRLLVRVVRVQSERAGHWIHGCAFPHPLTADELNALLRFA